ncbi:MAG: ketopantoate reductase C-terminal domain-containing protein [Thermoproteota archaeon]
MDIVVVGCGAVGLMLSAVFASQGHIPTVACLSESSLQLLRHGRVVVHSNGTTQEVRVEAKRLAPPALRDADAIVLAVPLNILEQVAANVAQVSKAKSVVLVQPSPYALDVAESLGLGGRVSYAMLYTCAVREGHRVHSVREGSLLAVSGPASSLFEAAPPALFERVKLLPESKLLGELWAYSSSHALVGSVAAILGVPASRIGPSQSATLLLESLVSEAELVASQLGVDSDIRGAVARMLSMRGCVPKLARDLEAGRQTEAEYMLGYIIRKGVEKGVYTPRLETVYLAIRALTETMRKVASG